MEHFAFNYISRPCHRGQQSAGSCSCFGTRWLSVEVIKMRTKILWLMFNLNFSTAWLPILAQHLSAMVSTSALKRRLTISEFDYAKPTTFTHAKKQEKKNRLRDTNCDCEFIQMCELKRHRWMREGERSERWKREPSATCNKTKKKKWKTKKTRICTQFSSHYCVESVAIYSVT